MTTYCDYCNSHPEDTFNRAYHDLQYGFPLNDDNMLFERLILEINQAGLSWITILKKADGFRNAYHGFKIEEVAKYTEKDRARLLADPGAIRNHLKINAAIVNARKIVELKEEYGSFRAWLAAHHPQSLDGWLPIFKRTFVFTGREIVKEFLVSTGYLPGAHQTNCPVYPMVARMNPPWLAS
jgi:DNA-3-methyladenine glycosylase I